jgi:hypothetical protein
MSKNTKPIFTASENMKNEYCAKIVRIGEMKNIEGSDFLVQTIVDGNSIVISKGMFETGEPVIYCMNETQLNKEFLSVNNQFEIGSLELNKNAKEVLALMDEGKNDEAKKLVGFFNKYGRVKLIRLRGCPSYGCIFKKESLVNWNKKLEDVNLEDYFTVDENGYEHPFEFDTIDGKLFAEAYVPPMPEVRHGRTDKLFRKRMKKLQRFNRMVPGQFSYHYSTSQLQANMWRFTPDKVVTISDKLHGTSSCNANVLTKIPIRLSLTQQYSNKVIKREIKMLRCKEQRFYWQRDIVKKRRKALEAKLIQNYRIDYGPVYSSRGVIKNQYINKNVTPGFYGVDIWSEYGELLKPYIPKGITVYSEICGYLTGSDKMIQKGYDYGCKRGENFIMPYRITFTDPEGNKTEWNVTEVYGWTINLIKEHPELAERVHPINILYHGTLGGLYPEISTTEHWQENVLQALKDDKEHFGMELNEPMCINKVPREGIVIRIDDDEKAEAFKLKCFKFLSKEGAELDANGVDIEMADAYGQK